MMNAEEVYCLVSGLPGNTEPGQKASERDRDKREKFAAALEALVPDTRRSMELREYTTALRRGGGYAGSAARATVRCGADPLVVVTTARLILS